MVIAYAWPVAGIGRLALVFPPSVPLLEAHSRIVAAGGVVVRSGAWPFVVIVEPLSAGDSSFIWRETGAWLAINPQFTGGCLQ